jgi:hypothetical protein
MDVPPMDLGEAWAKIRSGTTGFAVFFVLFFRVAIDCLLSVSMDER